jgi:transcriptional regulator with XRE-family HTH domain
MFGNIKAALASREMCGWQLARIIGVPQGVVSEIIGGRRHAGPALRKKIAEALRAPENWLFEEDVIPDADQTPKEGNVDPQIFMTIEQMAEFCSKVEEFSDIASRFLNDEDPAVRERAEDAIAKNDKLIEACRAFIAANSGPVN